MYRNVGPNVSHLTMLAVASVLASMDGGLPFNRPVDNGSPFPTGRYAKKKRRGVKHNKKRR